MEIIHAILKLFEIVMCMFSLWSWWKTGLKCPFYINFIAGIAFFLGAFIAYYTDSSAPINNWWLFGKWWIVLIMPALVYIFFGAYGDSIFSRRE